LQKVKIPIEPLLTYSCRKHQAIKFLFIVRGSFMGAFVKSSFNFFSIDLQRAAQLPFHPIYNFSQNELLVLKDYIEKSFARNFI